MMAMRMANCNLSLVYDNSVNIQSQASPSLCLNRRSLRPISFTAMVLFSIITFSSITLVRSFSLYPSFSGKNTFVKRVRQFQSRSFTSTIKYQQPLHTKLGAAADNDFSATDSNSNNELISNRPSPNPDDTGKKATDVVAAISVTTETTIATYSKDDGYDGLGEYDPSENLPQTQREVPNVGNPQLRVKEKDWSVTNILKELAAINQQGPQKYCILGTRHCSYLHQQIIELLAYALVLSGNHVYTSGAPGTNAATVRGALRAEREDLLTVVLPQSLEKQTKESQELLEKVDDLITMPQNDDMSLDVASRICNSYLLSLTDQLVSFAFHESNTVIEANKEAKDLDMLVTTLYLD